VRKLKICMITTFYPPFNFGGDGIFVQRLSEALVELGHEVHVLHDLDAYHAMVGQNSHSVPCPVASDVVVKSLEIPALGKLDLILGHQFGKPFLKRAAIKQYFEQFKFDVLHFHNVSLLGGPGLLTLGSAIKLVTLHDHWFVCPTHVMWKFGKEACTERDCFRCTLHAKRPPQFWRYGNAVAEACKSVDVFIAPSDFSVKNHYANGFPTKLTHLPHFVPDSFCTSSDKLSRHADRGYYLFVGRLEKLKGPHTLIDIFRKHSELELVFAGNGEFEEELKRLAGDMVNVKFLGTQNDEALGKLYQEAKAIIVPSLTYESFGLVVLEAFARGTPAIVRNLGALPELIKAGGGISYDTDAELEAAIMRLQLDGVCWQELSKQALSNVLNNYSQKLHLDRYLNIVKAAEKARNVS
jgi:glycosyltransferase involved in cell wall biosynthesis